jgi:hypothetical protein
MYDYHLGLDGGCSLYQAMPFFEVVKRKLLPLRIPSDGFVKNA